MIQQLPISIIIPVFKNYEMFFSNLKNNKIFITGCEVIVLNDFPQVKISNKVKAILPSAIAIDNNVNLGFASNINKGVKNSSGDYIFLLNSDVVLQNDDFKKSVDQFKKDKSIFALTFVQVDADGKLIGANKGFFKNGLINHAKQSVTMLRERSSFSRNFWAEGGSSIFRKDLFLKMGLFDPLYNPFYWEDVDLSYRAWKSGYKIFLFPEVKVQHQHESTIGKFFTKSMILKIAYRNQLIFQWKNITDRDLLISHFLSLPKLLFLSIMKGNGQFIQGFLLALLRLPQIIKSRNKTLKLYAKTDKEILNLFLNE